MGARGGVGVSGGIGWEVDDEIKQMCMRGDWMSEWWLASIGFFHGWVALNRLSAWRWRWGT
jgi:hypothetical protein